MNPLIACLLGMSIAYINAGITADRQGIVIGGAIVGLIASAAQLLSLRRPRQSTQETDRG
jgi:hypothetical protein